MHHPVGYGCQRPGHLRRHRARRVTALSWGAHYSVQPPVATRSDRKWCSLVLGVWWWAVLPGHETRRVLHSITVLPCLIFCRTEQQNKHQEECCEGTWCRCRGPGAKKQNMVYRGQKEASSLLVCATRHSQIEYGRPNVRGHIEREEICSRRCLHPQVHRTAAVPQSRPWQGWCVPVQEECEIAICLHLDWQYVTM